MAPQQHLESGDLLIAWPNFSQSQEHAVYNREACDMFGFGQVVVAGCHAKANDSLHSDAKSQTVPGADPITDKGADNCSRYVEEVDDCVPAEYGRKRGIFAVNSSKDSVAIDAEGIG